MIIMTIRGRADLRSNLIDETDGIDMSNVTTLSTRPKIIINGNTSSDSGGSFSAGTLDLLREIYQRIVVNEYYRHERYVVPATYKIVDQSSETTAKEILEEIDRVLRLYTLDNSHEYEYEMSYEVTTDRGEILATVSFVLIKKYVRTDS